MRRLYWDFYGARANGTADHFRIHLDDFIAKLEFSDCKTGLDVYTPAHSAAWCDAPDTACDVLVTRLRPHRADRIEDA